MADQKDAEEKRWKVDPSIFGRGPRPGLHRRLLFRLKPAGRLLLFALAFSSPAILTILGIIYGALVFWSSLGGLTLLIWLVVTESGYSRNFESANIDLKKRLLVLTLSFIAAVGFFLGLIHLGPWLIPLLVILPAIGLVYALRR